MRLGRRPGAAAPGRKARRWWRRCWWAPPISITWIVCGRDRCGWVSRRRRRRRSGRSCARSRGVTSASRQGCRGEAASGVGSRRRSRRGGDADRCGLVICEVAGKSKAGAAYGHTQQLGYHPLVGVRADTGEILHTRLRRGSSQSGQAHFVSETIARARRAGAAGRLCVRADSGFFATTSSTVWIASRALVDHHRPYAHVKTAIGAIPRRTGRPLPIPSAAKRTSLRPQLSPDGAATSEIRVVVRRTRLTDEPSCGRALPRVHHQPDLDPIAADKYHRQHATVELIRDLKEPGPAWRTCPSASPPTPPG